MSGWPRASPAEFLNRPGSLIICSRDRRAYDGPRRVQEYERDQDPGSDEDESREVKKRSCLNSDRVFWTGREREESSGRKHVSYPPREPVWSKNSRAFRADLSFDGIDAVLSHSQPLDQPADGATRPFFRSSVLEGEKTHRQGVHVRPLTACPLTERVSFRLRRGSHPPRGPTPNS